MTFSEVFKKHDKLALDECLKQLTDAGFHVTDVRNDPSRGDAVIFNVNTIPMKISVRSLKLMYFDDTLIYHRAGTAFENSPAYVDKKGKFLKVANFFKELKEKELNISMSDRKRTFKSVEEVVKWWEEHDLFNLTLPLISKKLNNANDKTGILEKNIYNMSKLNFFNDFKLFEAAYRVNNMTGKLDKMDDAEFQRLVSSGQAKKISLKDFFKGPVKSPYVGLVLKTSDGLVGVVIDVLKRNDDYLFDLFLRDGSVERNLSWSRDFKTAYGDRVNGWSAFGEDGTPNARHVEITQMLDKCEDELGIDLGVAAPSNLN